MTRRKTSFEDWPDNIDDDPEYRAYARMVDAFVSKAYAIGTRERRLAAQRYRRAEAAYDKLQQRARKRKRPNAGAKRTRRQEAA